MTLDQFKNKYSVSGRRENLLMKFEQFLCALKARFSQYRVLVFGSFITTKPEPGDIDVMVHVCLARNDPTNITTKDIQKLAPEGVHLIPTLSPMDFDSISGPHVAKLMCAESILEKFNTDEENIAKGIKCAHAIEVSM